MGKTGKRMQDQGLSAQLHQKIILPNFNQKFFGTMEATNSSTKTHGSANKASAFFNPTSTHISSTQLPKPSLPIAITDAICTPKSQRNLMPHLWDLIEPNIKCKR